MHTFNIPIGPLSKDLKILFSKVFSMLPSFVNRRSMIIISKHSVTVENNDSTLLLEAKDCLINREASSKDLAVTNSAEGNMEIMLLQKRDDKTGLGCTIKIFFTDGIGRRVCCGAEDDDGEPTDDRFSDVSSEASPASPRIPSLESLPVPEYVEENTGKENSARLRVVLVIGSSMGWRYRCNTAGYFRR
mmetsp:Transcript_16171/g.37485  ORF Transcript_16171/g.37485 Transcript_16171/m.37485 type:complete len:189 (-) Transcript_16171:1893-2459(-)